MSLRETPMKYGVTKQSQTSSNVAGTLGLLRRPPIRRASRNDSFHNTINMLNITIIALGKLKETYWREAEAEYIKRLTSDVSFKIVELKEESFDEKSNKEVTKQKEAEKIKKALEKTKDSYIIALDSTGQELSSTEISQEINKIMIDGNNSITFIIGGPLGLDGSIKKRADLILSLSKLTFTHQMVRTILLEQIYRSMMILGNRKYHY